MDLVEPVWANSIDHETWVAMVLRTLGVTHQGRLVVTRVETGEIVLDQGVQIAWDALCGPDRLDIARWQNLATEAIDAWQETR